MAYGYEGRTHFFFKLTPAQFEDLRGKNVDIHAQWLVCKDICLPGEATASLRAGPNSKTGNAPTDQALAAALSELPKEAVALENFSVYLAKAPGDNQLEFQYALGGVELEQVKRDRNLLTPFPVSPLTFKREKLFYDRENKTLYGSFSADWDGEYEDPPRALPNDGVFKTPISAKFALEGPDGPVIVEEEFSQFSLTGHEAFSQLTKNWTPIGGLDRDAPAALAEGAPKSSPNNSLALMLAMALLGGFILNFMPCVLPVISLKLFGLISNSGTSRAQSMRRNFSYAVGVIASFWALAGVVVGLKASGSQIGWGFQMQSPVFVFVMMVLIFIMALNMFGLFEFATPGGSKIGNIQTKDNLGGDFLNGVFATVLSTPCSAPFLGAALAFAFTTSAFNIFLILSFVGLGLASPFVLAGVFPKLVAFLPRPGAWMDTLKKIMGLPLLLTFLWLYDVLARQIDYRFSGLYLNVLLALVFFAFYFRKTISKNTLANGALFALPFLAALGLAQAGAFQANSQGQSTEQGRPAQAGEMQWSAWSEDSMQNLQGEWVFMDFTADWCLTCKVNEKLVLNTDAFSRLAQENGLKLLLGDWTRRDDKITQFLARNGSVGVPAYFIQTPQGELIKLGETISIEKIKKQLPR